MLSDDPIDTLVKALPFYLQDCLARGESDRTVEGKQCALGFFMRWCIAEGITTPQQLNLKVLEAYRLHLNQYRQPHKQKPLEPGSLRNRLTAGGFDFNILGRG